MSETVVKLDTEEKKKVYHLCSEGNRRIIQSSYWEKEIDEAVIMLNHLNEDFTGSKIDKFYKLY
jgi:hypothetical protein|tara:strand:- start:304 stop:495 length:192 start_codon:yes stop_codon:yes gene_type:complete